MIEKIDVSNFPDKIIRMAQEFEKNGACLYVVGGWVRDFIMNVPAKDMDLVIESDMSDNRIVYILNQFGKVVESDGSATTGKNFGVFRVQIDGVVYEVARTRTEIGGGASTNTIVLTEDVTIEQDLARRDFTINAVAIRIVDGVVIDPLNGQRDIEDWVLAYCSHSFYESIERPLRLAVIASKLLPNFFITDNLLQMCKNMANWPGMGMTHAEAKACGKHAIPKDQLFTLFSKAMMNKRPDMFVRVLNLIDWLKHFPEIAVLEGCPQEPEWHPEGDVFEHTCQVMEQGALIANRENLVGEDRLVLMLACLCHDMGKPCTTELKVVHGKERITSYDHEDAGVPIADKFLRSIGTPNHIIDRVLPLVKHHMAFASRQRQDPKAIARWVLHTMGQDWVLLRAVMEADVCGRGSLPKVEKPRTTEIFHHVMEIGEFTPIVTGKMLVSMGMKPGVDMGNVIRDAVKLQIKGKIHDNESAVKYVMARKEFHKGVK